MDRNSEQLLGDSLSRRRSGSAAKPVECVRGLDFLVAGGGWGAGVDYRGAASRNCRVRHVSGSPADVSSFFCRAELGLAGGGAVFDEGTARIWPWPGVQAVWR